MQVSCFPSVCLWDINLSRFSFLLSPCMIKSQENCDCGYLKKVDIPILTVYNILCSLGRVVESVDTMDLKSIADKKA